MKTSAATGYRVAVKAHYFVAKGSQFVHNKLLEVGDGIVNFAQQRWPMCAKRGFHSKKHALLCSLNINFNEVWWLYFTFFQKRVDRDYRYLHTFPASILAQPVRRRRRIHLEPLDARLVGDRLINHRGMIKSVDGKIVPGGLSRFRIRLEGVDMALRANEMRRQQGVEPHVGAQVIDDITFLYMLRERLLKLRLSRPEAISCYRYRCAELQPGPDAALNDAFS